MMGVLGRVTVLSVFAASVILLQFSAQNLHAQIFQDSVVISEIKLGGTGEPKEYISLYNLGSSPVDLTGWRLQYAKNEFTSASCNIADWSSVVGGSSISISGSLPAGNLLVLERQLNDSGSGALRVIDDNNTVVDLVGWGTFSPCYESSPTTTPSSGKSLVRYLGCDDNFPIDTDNNLADFASNQIPTPLSLTVIYAESCDDGEPQDPDEEQNDGGSTGGSTTSNCEGLLVNELLPNPGGDDSGSEFIELYNPTSTTVSLKNCKLQTSANSREHVFGNTSIGAKKHLALFDDATDLVLANSSGGTVWLLNHNDVELNEVEYPEDMEDDVSWARFSDGWEQTYNPTPGEANISQPTKPCPEGQYRSTDTNRCRDSLVASALLTPCRDDQFRNPETNRCKLISSTSSALKACNADQFRNPETNRCKKYAAASTLKPCKPDQERNPETNRCRKVAAAGTVDNMTGVSDVPAAEIANKAGMWFAGASVVGALGYAAFEWRKEFAGGLGNLKAKFATSGQ